MLGSACAHDGIPSALRCSDEGSIQTESRGSDTLEVMASKPTMQIIHDADRFPVSAKCSACNIEMSAGEFGKSSAEENLKWLKAHFNLHAVQSHPRRKHQRTTSRRLHLGPFFGLEAVSHSPVVNDTVIRVLGGCPDGMDK